MTRLHRALLRAGEGTAPVLPDGVAVPPPDAADSSQPAFSVPWTFDNGQGAVQGGGAGPVAQDSAVASPAPASAPAHAHAPRAGFTPSAARHVAPISKDLDEKLVGTAASSSSGRFAVALEQYRKLAAALHHAQAERGLKLVLVTSANPGEGKSLTTLNLALTLSESYQRRVLLIDGDLRRPSLHDAFGLSNEFGLSDGLARASARGLAVVEVSPRLWFLPSGSPMTDPTTALSSPQMREVLEDARATYDWVVIDTPPVGLMADARLLAKAMDGVILVIGAGSTAYQEAQRAIEEVGRDRLLGAVLNRAEDLAGDGKYYRRYYARPSDHRV